MMNDLSLFSIVQEPNALWVIVGVSFLALSTSCIGIFAWLNRQSLIGDAMAHCALPGIAFAFLLSQSRHPLVILPAAIVSSLIGNWLLNWLIGRTKMSPDSALAIVLSGFFSIGAMALSVIQKLPIAGKAGIDQMLFGQAAALDNTDLAVLIVATSVVLITVVIILPHLTMIIFDKQHSQSVGVNVHIYKQVIGLLVVICVVIGIQIVGVVLMSALLIFPAISARQWTHRLKVLMIIAMMMAVFASISGVMVSYRYNHMPTGPWIVVVLSLFMTFSLLVSPRNGYMTGIFNNHRRQSIIYAENIIRLLYLVKDKQKIIEFTLSDILKSYSLDPKKLKQGLHYSLKKGWINITAVGYYTLTPQGIQKAQMMTRGHRLWEQYLSQNKKFSEQNSHYSAEYAEHIIDEELADKLDDFLGYPDKDPHGQWIPAKPNKQNLTSKT